MDILKEIKTGKLSSDAAYDRIDGVVADVHAGKYNHLMHEGGVDIGKLLGMDKYEYTAYSQGAGLDDLVVWRYYGWPESCNETGKPIEYKKFGWLVKEVNDKSVLVLL